MFFDEKGLIERENDPVGNPGRIGDSCAETSREWVLVTNMTGPIPSDDEQKKFWHFYTEKGFIRHPNVPWGRELDFPTDQAQPLYLAAPQSLKTIMKERIQNDGWRTSLGTKLISPLFWAILNDHRRVMVFCLWTQAQLFKLPLRWNDEKKWFESTKKSSCDYLNWIVTCVALCPDALRFIPKEMLIEKVTSYYAGEPRAFVVWFYRVVIERLYPS